MPHFPNKERKFVSLTQQKNISFSSEYFKCIVHTLKERDTWNGVNTILNDDKQSRRVS